MTYDRPGRHMTDEQWLASTRIVDDDEPVTIHWPDQPGHDLVIEERGVRTTVAPDGSETREEL